jgi:hypothetical protein
MAVTQPVFRVNVTVFLWPFLLSVSISTVGSVYFHSSPTTSNPQHGANSATPHFRCNSMKGIEEAYRQARGSICCCVQFVDAVGDCFKVGALRPTCVVGVQLVANVAGKQADRACHGASRFGCKKWHSHGVEHLVRGASH